MKAYLLLLPISFLPAVAGILVTRPMWRIRQLPNEAIQGIGLVVMISVLIGYLVPLFLGDTGAVGCACILLSLFNLVIFQYYEQRLNTSRCPQCHTRNLHVRRTLQTLLPALRPAQPVAHMAVFFERSLTMSRKAVRLPLHPARRTCV